MAGIQDEYLEVAIVTADLTVYLPVRIPCTCVLLGLRSRREATVQDGTRLSRFESDNG